MITKLRFSFLLIFLLPLNQVFGQAPNISYTTPQTFNTGTPISAISPVNKGGAVPANTYGQVTTFAGTAGSSGFVNATGAAARFSFPTGIAADAAGNLYVIDFNNVVRRISTSGVVTTYAGSGGYGAQNGPASQATFYNMSGITVDPSGNVYVADQSNEAIRKITPGGIVSTFAGKIGVAGFANGSDTSAEFYSPLGLASDKNGNVYVADYFNDLIRKITPAGIVSTYAGRSGVKGSINGPDSVATFNHPIACATDGKGNLYVLDSTSTVRVISPSGMVSTVAGSTISGSSDGTGTAATFHAPEALIVDPGGNIYVADNGNLIVRKITPAGVVTTLAGTAGKVGAADGVGSQASFNGTYGIAIDPFDNLYITDIGNSTIRKISTTGFSLSSPVPSGVLFDLTTGTISGTPHVAAPPTSYTVAAYNLSGSSTTTINIGVTGTLNFPPIPPVAYGAADFSPAISTLGPVTYTGSDSTAVIVSGKVHILKAGSCTITANDGSTTLSQTLTVSQAPLTIIADNKNRAYNTANPALTFTYDGFVNGDNNTALSIQPAAATTAVVSSAPGCYPITVGGANAANYAISYINGTFTVLGGQTTLAPPEISYPKTVVYPYGKAISPLSPSNSGGAIPANTYGLVKTVAGQAGVQGSQNGAASTATFYQPYGIVEDKSGNLFVADQANNEIRKITPAGVVSVFAGSGTAGATNGQGTAAQLSFPSGLAIDSVGNIYVADQGNSAVRKITPQGVVSTLAVGFENPWGIAIDKNGTLYVADTYEAVIDKVSPTGVVTRLAGSLHVQGHQDGTGSGALFQQPSGIVVDAFGNVFVADLTEIRKITPSGVVTTLAGSGKQGFADGTGTSAQFEYLELLTIDPAGNIYTGDENAIRRISAEGVVTTIAGSDALYGSTNGIGAAARFNEPIGFFIDQNGVLCFTDGGNELIRTMSLTGYSIDKSLPNGLAFDPTTGVISGTPTQALLATNYTVTGNNVSGNSTAVIALSVKPSTKAFLSALTVSQGTLSPAFQSTVTNYSIALPNIDSALMLTPTLADITAQVAVNGAIVISGRASQPVALNVGANIISVVVTQNGVTTQTYTIAVTRAANNNLAKLAVSSGTLSPTFAPGITNYSVSVLSNSSTIKITPTAADPAATIKVNGMAVKSGAASAPISLNTGANSINVVVTAHDGVTTQTYTITVGRGSSDAYLSNLKVTTATLSPAFAFKTLNYTASVPNTTASITVTPYLLDTTASSININGYIVANKTATIPLYLPFGTSVIDVVVTAQDGVTKQAYRVSITKQQSTVATLSDLQVSSGTLSPAFVSGTTSYMATVATTTTAITVTPTTTDTTAIIIVNGQHVTSNTASPPINLAVGTDTIRTVVTAQDGVTKDTYTLIVTRAASGTNDAYLSNLKVTNATLSPSFAFKTLAYTSSVPNSTASVTVTPALLASTASSLTVNGKPVANKTASQPIPLVIGTNTVNVTVVAQDGVTTQTYTVTIIRAPSAIATLSKLQISSGTLTPAFASGTTAYSATVATTTTSLTVTPTTTDTTETVTVNGKPVKSNTPSGVINLAIGTDTITTVVTAQDGVTRQTYRLTVTCDAAGTNNAWLSNLKVTTAALSPAFNFKTFAYTSTVANSTDSVTVTPSLLDAAASVTVTGVAVASKTASGPVVLAVGTNTINIVVIAEDGITTNTYTVTITRAAGPVNGFDPGLSVNNPVAHPVINDDIIVVHSGLSPNGDGVNDFLQIDNISHYPDNKLAIMNRSGQLIYEVQGYNNSSKVFDGHNNKNGQMQLPGTYFYQLDYTVDGIVEHKTGFIVLKY